MLPSKVVPGVSALPGVNQYRRTCMYKIAAQGVSWAAQVLITSCDVVTAAGVACCCYTPSAVPAIV